MSSPAKPAEVETPPLPWITIVAAAVAIGALVIASPYFRTSLTAATQEQVLRMGIVALMAASLALVNGAAGQFSLGHAAFQGVGAYSTAAIFALLFSDSNGLFSSTGPMSARDSLVMAIGARGAILLGGVVAAVVGGLVAWPCLRLRGDYLAIVTLGFNIIVGVVIRSLGHIGRVDMRGAEGFNEIPRGVAGSFLDIYVTLFLAIFVLWRLVHKGRGLDFAAVRDDEVAAEAVGINTSRTKVTAFVVSSFIAGVAGGLYAFKMGAISDSAFDLSHSFDYVVMVILGGNGNLVGAVIAAGFLTYLNDRLSEFDSWRPVAYSFALVWIMVARIPSLAGIAASRLGRSSAVPSTDASTVGKSIESLGFLQRSDSEAAVLAIQNMTIRFGGLVAVDGVNLSIRSGECVGLIGPNGAGKSTIFNAITGIYRLSNGQIELAGASIGSRRPSRLVKLGAARTFQNIRLFSGMTVLDNVRAAAWSRHEGGMISAFVPTAKTRRAEACTNRESQSLIAALGLAGLEKMRASSLPYGAQRRLEIARALATGPKLLLLDEPAAGMNSNERQALITMLRSISNDLGIAMLLIEHDLALVSDVCPRILVLDYGKSIAEGSPEQIRADPKVIEAYLGPEFVEDGS